CADWNVPGGLSCPVLPQEHQADPPEPPVILQTRQRTVRRRGLAEVCRNELGGADHPGRRGIGPRRHQHPVPDGGPGWTSGFKWVRQENAVRVEAASTVFLVASRAKIPVGLGGSSLRPMIWMFLAILVTFLLTRTVTRLIRSGSGARAGLGNVRIGGHH